MCQKCQKERTIGNVGVAPSNDDGLDGKQLKTVNEVYLFYKTSVHVPDTLMATSCAWLSVDAAQNEARAGTHRS